MSTIKILNESHYPMVWAIFHGVFEHKYITEFLDVWNARNKDLSIGVFDDQQILLGFLLTKQVQNSHQQIEFIGVNPTVQKGGVGTSLLRFIVDYCQQNGLTVTLIPVNDDKIIGWYKKNGFREYGAPVISKYTGDLEQTMIYGK